MRLIIEHSQNSMCSVTTQFEKIRTLKLFFKVRIFLHQVNELRIFLKHLDFDFYLITFIMPNAQLVSAVIFNSQI